METTSSNGFVGRFIFQKTPFCCRAINPGFVASNSYFLRKSLTTNLSTKDSYRRLENLK